VAKSKPDVIGSSVAHLLRKKRMAKGLSMYVVAKRARMSHSMISRVEHELCRPSLDTLLRIAVAMEIDLWPLIKQAEQSLKTVADNSAK
jgi:transcriptional regulator with XRE-family HTH domain